MMLLMFTEPYRNKETIPELIQLQSSLKKIGHLYVHI